VTISLLLPTRDRLQYLRFAIETIRRQEYSDWEIVVADNASEDPIGPYIKELADPRIIYTRTESPISVTENWNRALAASRGEWVLMLGDDDGLMPGALERLMQVAAQFSTPDVIYSGAWLYMYPGVDPNQQDGFLQSNSYATFLRNRSEPYLVPNVVAHKHVDHMMNFRLRFGFNMQFACVHRRMVEKLSLDGQFYQSEFPDYYAMNMLFLKSDRIVALPEHIAVIGVTPKSYGFYHVNSKEKDGRKFLQCEEKAATMPAGSYINSGWLDAAKHIAAVNGSSASVKPNMRRFRMLQVAHLYEQIYLEGKCERSELALVFPKLQRRERFVWRSVMFSIKLVARIFPRRLAQAYRDLLLVARGQIPSWGPPKIVGRHKTIIDVFQDPSVRS
jgi:glycosyltransferase involved in cell wall biosynthesis